MCDRILLLDFTIEIKDIDCNEDAFIFPLLKYILLAEFPEGDKAMPLADVFDRPNHMLDGI